MAEICFIFLALRIGLHLICKNNYKQKIIKNNLGNRKKIVNLIINNDMIKNSVADKKTL